MQMFLIWISKYLWIKTKSFYYPLCQSGDLDPDIYVCHLTHVYQIHLLPSWRNNIPLDDASLSLIKPHSWLKYFWCSQNFTVIAIKNDISEISLNSGQGSRHAPIPLWKAQIYIFFLLLCGSDTPDLVLLPYYSNQFGRRKTLNSSQLYCG